MLLKSTVVPLSRSSLIPYGIETKQSLPEVSLIVVPRLPEMAFFGLGAFVRGPIQSDIQAWCNWFCFFFCACVCTPKARVEIEAAKGWHRSATDAMGRVQERPSIAQSRFPRTGQSSFQGSEIEPGAAQWRRQDRPIGTQRATMLVYFGGVSAIDQRIDMQPCIVPCIAASPVWPSVGD
jgi:hypothetical protein